MAEQLKAGDTVRLNSGGPLMTIYSIDSENQTALCEWFDKKDLKSSSFKLTSLMADDDDVHISFT